MKRQRDKVAANKKSTYRSFIRDRDRALERLHVRAQERITSALAVALARSYDLIASRIGHAANTLQGIQSAYILDQIARRMDHEFFEAQKKIVEAFITMRRNSYLLTYSSEAEAIARLIKDPKEFNLHAGKLSRLATVPSAVGGAVADRVNLALGRLKQKVLDQVKLGLILGETVAEIMDRVKTTFPKIHRYAAPKKILKTLKEARRPTDSPESYSFGTIDQESWEDLIQDYTQTYSPEIRDPELYFDIVGNKFEAVGLDEGEWMGWEIEQQLTADFVQQVRSGQIDAARDQGISDFVWITVIGKTTCESCIWRNGLTSSEIEAKLDGDHRDDEIDATVPPAHASCRCQVAPMVEALETESAPKELGDFSTWLKQ